MKHIILILFVVLPFTILAQKSKYYGWWEHKGALHNQDSLTIKALSDYSHQHNIDFTKIITLSETEIQFTEDSFKINYGISMAIGDADSREFKWFSTLSGTWKIDKNNTFLKHGKFITIRENNFTIGEENWKDSIVNHTIHFTYENAELIALKFNNGSTANGVFSTRVAYPYIWFYLEYGFGNVYTKYY